MAKENLLTDIKLKALKSKPGEKLRRHKDGGGLFFVVHPSGRTWFEYRYNINGKKSSFGLGGYPDVSIKEARDKHKAAKAQVVEGVDPAATKKAAIAAKKTEGTSFREVADSWLEHRKKLIKEGKLTGKDVWTGRLRNHLMPALGSKPIAEITSREILNVLLRVKDRGNEATVSKLRNILNGIYQHAKVRMGLTIGEPMNDLRRISELKRTSPAKHFRYADTPEKLGVVLAALESVKDGTLAQRAVWLAPRVFLRPDEIAGAMWSEINLEKRIWRVDKQRMKMKNDHIVPLSTQVIRHLAELKELTGDCEFVFPSIRTKGFFGGRLNPESLRKVLTDLGFGKQALSGGTTTHGFRHCAATFLRERGFNGEWIEIQMAHSKRNTVEATYNHASYLPQRYQMMQAWSEYLDQLARAVADGDSLNEAA